MTFVAELQIENLQHFNQLVQLIIGLLLCSEALAAAMR